MELHEAERIGPIMASVSNDYRRQVNYPDTVHVGVRVTRIGRSSLAMEHKIVSRKEQLVAAEGSATIVVFDYQTGQSHPVPARIRHAIESLEGHAF
jgi:acyl-CoA thioester hydrolase